jgi:hypothetical protein
VILPARLADVELRLRQEPLQEICAELERAGAAQRLSGHDAAVFDELRITPEQQRLDLLAVADQAIDREIRLRILLFVPAPLGFAHHREHRHLALAVLIHADAKIDLVRILVGYECLGEPQNRVGRGQVHIGKGRLGHVLCILNGAPSGRGPTLLAQI